MKIKIEKIFKDKNTKECYEVGQIIEVDEARGKELLADPRKLVSSAEEAPKPKKSSVKKSTKK